VRDPDGFLERQGSRLVRRLVRPSDTSSFIQTAAASKLVAEGKLVAFKVIAPDLLEVEQVPFVTAPFEWCDAQLRDAALLTLDVSESALDIGHELKDSSAWNVIFNGCRPVFCDHLSFRPIRRQQWWAFGQFLRHFAFPLAKSASTGLGIGRIFRLSRDGLQADEARRLLGMRQFGTRLWPVLLFSQPLSPKTPLPGKGVVISSHSTEFHSHLYRYCRWSLPRVRSNHAAARTWLRYTATRQHYTAQARDAKAETVGRWLDTTRPEWLVDLGANTGEYTFMAAGKGAKVIAVEQDAECVNDLYERADGSLSIFPVLSNLGDLCGGCGWLGSEQSGLHSRLRGAAQMVLALAVLHHLAISESIPLDRISEFVADITTRHAIVELIPEDDPMVLRLSVQRERNAHEFSVQAQLAAFSPHFEILATHELEGSRRVLVLMERRSS